MIIRLYTVLDSGFPFKPIDNMETQLHSQDRISKHYANYLILYSLTLQAMNSSNLWQLHCANWPEGLHQCLEASNTL